ncbi:MAG: hypothetical protein EOP10_12800 [Proteobacteria bacterium]|nr:MAG: hypothetical protein EOP10_12800 [Pseudomonadota bacterium]
MKIILSKSSLGLASGLLLFTLNAQFTFADEADETVEAKASRIQTERIELSRASQSVLIQPEEASRFDAETQLRLESSLTFIETGRISPSGFIIPKIRAQDSKLTDVYLDNIILSDPYSGLPLVEDLDLRAFGSMELHQGVSPYNVPSSNPVGVLRYRFRNVSKSRATLGAVTGSPYGHSLWGNAVYKSEDQELRLYGRTHQTSGRYRYYSDQGTPYNSRDDKEKTRANNDQRSNQLLPVYRQDLGPFTLQALAWWHEANRAIASGSTTLSSTARDKSKGWLGDLSLTHDADDIGPISHSQWTVHVGRKEDERLTNDPQRLVLNSVPSAATNIKSNRQGLLGELDFGTIKTHFTLEEAQSEIEQSYDTILSNALDRSNESVIFAAAYTPLPKLLIEGKLSSHRQWDKSSVKSGIVLSEEQESGKRYRFARAESLSAAYGEDLGLYAQIARSRRLPSLYEEFGNGSTVRPNSELKPEMLFHRELGLFSKWKFLRLGATYYLDQTDEKIVVIPILASASKALNVAKTRIAGTDLEAIVTFDETTLTAKGSAQSAKDRSLRKERRLPGTPEKVWLGEWRQSWTKTFITHINGRYRSEVYRDFASSVKIPELVTYDMNLDYSWSQFELGLAVRNLLNTKDTEVESGSSHGRTAASDVAGQPLPGRQWVLSFVTNWE